MDWGNKIPPSYTIVDIMIENESELKQTRTPTD